MTMEERDSLEEQVRSLPDDQRFQLGNDMMFWSFGYFYDVHTLEVNGWFDRLKLKVDAMEGGRSEHGN